MSKFEKILKQYKVTRAEGRKSLVLTSESDGTFKVRAIVNNKIITNKTHTNKVAAETHYKRLKNRL